MNIKKTTTLFLSLSILTFLGGCETEEEATPAPTGAVESSYASNVHDEPYEFTDETGTYLIDEENATRTPILREGDVVGEDAYASTEGKGKGEIDFNFTYSYDDGDYTEMLSDVAKEVEKPLSELMVLSEEQTLVQHIKPVNTVDEKAMDIKDSFKKFITYDDETTSTIYVMKKAYDQITMKEAFTDREIQESKYLYAHYVGESVVRENGSPLSEDLSNMINLYETDDVVVILVPQAILMGHNHTPDDDEYTTTPYEEKSLSNIVDAFKSENVQDAFAKHLN